MRDDLHKGAPVPRIWQSLIRRCTSDATWNADAPPFAKKAVQELANRIGPGIVSALLKSLEEPQISLDPARSLASLQRKSSDPLETVMIDQARLAVRMGPIEDAPKIVSEAIRAAVEFGMEAHLRATSLHVLGKSPGSERELMLRLKSALAEAGVNGIVDAKVRQEPQESVRLVRTIDLEEDISGR